MAVEQNVATQLERSDMTQVMQNTDRTEVPQREEGDIPISDITGTNILSTGDLDQINTFPMIFPNSPVFRVPANPLLPEEYSEFLDYNSLQYLNGFFRTQIGRYVRVQQLVGSNTLEDHEGFLIGVGINYIILQDYANGNLRVLDIYGIKSMYVYYAEITNPYRSSTE